MFSEKIEFGFGSFTLHPSPKLHQSFTLFIFLQVEFAYKTGCSVK